MALAGFLERDLDTNYGGVVSVQFHEGTYYADGMDLGDPVANIEGVPIYRFGNTFVELKEIKEGQFDAVPVDVELEF